MSRHAFICLLAVLLLALALRLGFAALVVAQHDNASFTDIHGDTAGYLRIGERMYDRRGYTAEGAVHRNRGLIRPPGYPAFYTAVRRAYDVIGVDLSKDLRPIVWPQVMISTLGVAATFGIALVALRSTLAATIAGTLAALSPTGIACSAIAMPDSSFAVWFAVAFLGFVKAATCRSGSLAPVPGGEGWGEGVVGRDLQATDELRPKTLTPALSREYTREGAIRASRRWTVFAGLSLAVAALQKPAAIYWPLFAIPALLAVRGANRKALADIRRLFLPLAIVVAIWTGYNARFEGVPAYSIVSARNLRYGVAPKVELLAKLGRMPTQAEYVRYAAIAADRDDAFIRADNANPGELYRRITRETREIFLAHPLETARVLASNLLSQTTSRYKLIHRQLPKAAMGPTNAIRRLFVWTDSPLALVLWYVPLLTALPLAWWRRREWVNPLLLCWLGFLYIALPTASVADEGSRLILAGEPMAITLIAASLSLLVQPCAGVALLRLQSQPSRSVPSAPAAA